MFQVPRPKSYSLEDWGALLRPFQMPVWIVMIACYIVLLLEYWIYRKHTLGTVHQDGVDTGTYALVLIAILFEETFGKGIKIVRHVNVASKCQAFSMSMSILESSMAD